MEESDSIFSILANLPLFRGVSRERITATAGLVKFHFLKYSNGEVISNEGDPCTHVKFVISGSVKLIISNSSGRFIVSQVLSAPDVISPDFLFGPSTQYPGKVVANGDVSIVQISKSDYVRILSSDNIFLFNYLNFLAMNAQKCVEGVLALTNGSIEERLAMWVVAMTQPTAKEITLQCKQRDLYAIFGVQRSSFIAALDNLVAQGMITYAPGEIKVLDRRAMMRLLRTSLE